VPRCLAPAIASSLQTTPRRKVLNNTWTSISQGSERAIRASGRDKALFQTEDERFEVDYKIELGNTTIDVLNRTIDRARAQQHPKHTIGPVAASVLAPELLWHPIHRKCLRLIYGRHLAREVVELIKTDINSCVPLIVGHLKRKVKAWELLRTQHNRGVWHNKMKKSYEKSLAHQRTQDDTSLQQVSQAPGTASKKRQAQDGNSAAKRPRTEPQIEQEAAGLSQEQDREKTSGVAAASAASAAVTAQMKSDGGQGRQHVIGGADVREEDMSAQTSPSGAAS